MKTNQNYLKNCLTKTFKDKRGFTIEMAILVIIIMSGICMLLITLMLVQNNKNNVEDTLIDSETTICQYGEDFYNVCKYVAWGADVTEYFEDGTPKFIGSTIINSDKNITNPNAGIVDNTDPNITITDHLDNYKQYLENYFYPENVSSEKDPENSNIVIWSSSPSSSVLKDTNTNTYYLYQPIGADATSYYYSYNIKNYTNAYELTISIHKATNEYGVYSISDKKLVDGYTADDENYFTAIVYGSPQVVLSVRVDKIITIESDETTTINYKTTKWFYDSPTEVNTLVAKDFLPYEIQEEKRKINSPENNQ